MAVSNRSPEDRLMYKLSKSSNRATLYAVILLAGAGSLLAGLLWWQFSNEVPSSVDKALHYRSGQIFAAVIFYLSYVCIVVRVLIAGRGTGSITRVLLWLPVMIAGALALSVAGVFLVSVLKEVFDLGGGTIEWLDITAALDGAMTIVPFVGIIMALTPLCIPLDILMQLPKLMRADMRTGIGSFDDYLKELKWHSRRDKPPEVLVIEDDMDCAAVAMNFCRNMGLRCYHVSSAKEGFDYIYHHIDEIRLVVLDNFLRVDCDGCNMTGSEWLKEINGKYPVNKRSFSVVITSGHTEMLGDSASYADLVLQKPWSPFILGDFLKDRSIVNERNPAHVD